MNDTKKQKRADGESEFEFEQRLIIENALDAFDTGDDNDEPPSWEDYETVCNFLDTLNGESALMFDELSNVSSFGFGESSTSVMYRVNGLGDAHGRNVVLTCELDTNGHENGESVKDMLMDFVREAEALQREGDAIALIRKPENRAALEQVVHYLIGSEETHFEETCIDDDGADNGEPHIYRDAETLQKLLEQLPKLS